MEEGKEPKPRIWLMGGDGKIQPVDHRESSTEPVFLKTDGEERASLSKRIARLSFLNAKITYGTYRDQDLVDNLYQGFKVKVDPQFPKLTRVSQYLAAKTIESLTEKGDNEIRGKSFPMGYLKPEELVNTSTIEEYFKILSHDYPTYQIVLREFLMGRTLGSGNMEENTAIEISKLESGVGLRDERDQTNRYFLLKTLRDDLISLDKPISLGIAEFFDPYLMFLGQLKEGERIAAIQKMFNLEYPFNPENRYDPDHNDNWKAEILSMAHPNS